MAQHLLQFQSSRSLRTATARPSCLCNDFRYFNPRGPCGPRLAIVMVFAWWGIRFQSSRSLRTATSPETGSVITQEISILAVLADRDRITSLRLSGQSSFQSSRSLRTATASISLPCKSTTISILAVLADRDPCCPGGPDTARTFQSSRSLRTATGSKQCHPCSSSHFNPCGPCGPRRDGGGEPVPGAQRISILAVLADRDFLPSLALRWG